MPVRHRHKRGEHLVQDDDTGFVHYSSEMVRLWDGRIVHRREYETRQPQEFIKSLGDPYPVSPIRVMEALPEASLAPPIFVGVTNIPAPRGPAWHIYDFGIGKMEIGDTFQVR